MKEMALGVLFWILGAIVVLMLIVIAVVFAPAKAASKAPVNGFRVHPAHDDEDDE